MDEKTRELLESTALGRETLREIAQKEGWPDPAKSKTMAANHRELLMETPAGRVVLADRGLAYEYDDDGNAVAVEPPPAPPPAPPTPPPAVGPPVLRVEAPPPPTTAEDAEFCAWLGKKPERSARLLTKAIDAISGEIGRAVASGNAWTFTVARAVARRLTLEAMRTAIEEGKPYQSPDPSEVMEEQGRKIVEEALARPEVGAAGLIRAIRGREALVRREADLAAKRLESLAGEHKEIAEMRREFAIRHRLAESTRAESTAISSTCEKIGKALAEAVKSAVEKGGGRGKVTEELADAILLDTPAHGGRGESGTSALRAQLEAIGEDSQGRAAEAIRAEITERERAADWHRAEAREKAERGAIEAARAMVDRASSGDLGGLRELLEKVVAHPKAFEPGFGRALRSVPAEAFEVAGYAGFASISL